MPYITEKDKERLIAITNEINSAFMYEDIDAGTLNYLFTKIALEYLWRKGTRYKYFNDIIGALECCKQELYRRRIAPYEDKKITENGDVFE